MLAQAFQIKVALLGHVSVGKTTVLNALLQDKFSEVSKSRTTAGVNHFRILFRSNKEEEKNDTNTAKQEIKSDTLTSTEKNVDDLEEDCSLSSGDSKTYKMPNQILDEIIKDNSVLREKRIIQKKVFSVKLDKTFVQMRDDTQLVLVDIPGVNEAGSSKLYLDYVRDSWNGFDAVIVVMDVEQGVNTEDQVELLKFVKKNRDKQKQVPLIILVNKVDDPDDEETKALVGEIRHEVERIFNVKDREKSLCDILSNENKTAQQKFTSASPAFIPISAENGFLYRAASNMKQSNFNKLDMAYIDKIGREEIGKFKWKRLTNEQKYDEVYKVVSDPDQYKERLEASNFDKFLSVLEYFVGGDVTQKDIIGKRLDASLKFLSHKSNIAESLSSMYDKFKVVDKPTEPLKNAFWRLQEECNADAFKEFSQSPAKVSYLRKPMKELVDYSQGIHKKLQGNPSSDIDRPFLPAIEFEEKRQIIQSMKAIIKQQCEVILKKNPFDQLKDWKWIKPGNKNTLSWNELSPRDWTTAISSILLMTHNKHFCENFGKQIADLQWLSHIAGSFGVSSTKGQANSYFESVRISVPDSPSDPNHWGHLAWAFCQFMESEK